jgi:peptidyl-prolyl cis-trans isomerase C
MLAASVAESDLVQVFIETTIDPLVVVSPEDVETYYKEHPEMFQRPEQVHARHILMTAGPDASPEAKAAARAKAEAARKRALAGEDFATLATEVSEGPSAPKGGDLGFFARQQMVAPFADAAFALEVGQISEVVETQFGYHVIKVEEKRPASMMTFAEVQKPLTEMLRQNKGGEQTTKVLDQLAEKATITQAGQGGAAPVAAAGGE